jgi:hypothetical protein
MVVGEASPDNKAGKRASKINSSSNAKGSEPGVCASEWDGQASLSLIE